MVTTLFLTFITPVVGAVLSPLPSGGSLGFSSAVSKFLAAGPFQWLGWVNNYVPLSEGLVALGLILGVFAVVLGVNVSVWVLTKFHILGGS